MKPNLSRLLVSMAVILLLVSCSKELPENTAENYFFKAKFNGVEKSFLTRSSATRYGMDGKFVLSIIASMGNQTSSISLWSKDNSFKEGNSFNTESAGSSSNNSFDYTSNQLSGHPETSFGSVYIGGDNVLENFNCKLTEVTSTYVRGTFEADLYSRSAINPSKILVRDGEFYVRLQQ